MPDPTIANRLKSARFYRIVGVCSLVGAVLMLIAWFRLERPGLLVSSALQLVGWFLWVTYANRLELEEERESATGGTT